jgi:FkbM family methyltransferase
MRSNPVALLSENLSFAALTGNHSRIKIVDIGASLVDGKPPYLPLLRNGEADVVGFEPNPEALAKLNSLKGSHETYLPHAVGDGRRQTLHVCLAQGMTSLFEPNRAVLERFHAFAVLAQVKEKRAIDTVRLDDIEETTGVELLKIDIQGAELMVFQNATDRLRGTLVVHTEVEFLQMYVGQPLFAEVEIFLRQQGFAFHRFFPEYSRVITPFVIDGDLSAGMSQLLWADAIFIKDYTRLEKYSDQQLLSAAKIVHECYQSFDLTYLLLREYDRRLSSSLAASYISGLRSPGAAAA